MCTLVMSKQSARGSAKGAGGWFAITQVYTGYDHPAHAPLEHALTLDFVDEDAGPSARVAVELSRESARDLAHRILAALDEGERHE